MEKQYLTKIGLRLNGKSYKHDSTVSAKPEDVQDLVDAGFLIEQAEERQKSQVSAPSATTSANSKTPPADNSPTAPAATKQAGKKK